MVGKGLYQSAPIYYYNCGRYSIIIYSIHLAIQLLLQSISTAPFIERQRIPFCHMCIQSGHFKL